MDVRLPEELTQLQLAVRAFVDGEVLPREAEIEERDRVPESGLQTVDDGPRGGDGVDHRRRALGR
jgi:hypothetical protein